MSNLCGATGSDLGGKGVGRLLRGKERAPRTQGFKGPFLALGSHEGRQQAPRPRRPDAGRLPGHLRLGRCGLPRRGAPCRAGAARRLASTWAGDKFAGSGRERPAAPGLRRAPRARRAPTVRGAGGAGGSAAGRARPQPRRCCVPAVSAALGRPAPPLPARVPIQLCDFLGATPQPLHSCGFSLSKLWETGGAEGMWRAHFRREMLPG